MDTNQKAQASPENGKLGGRPRYQRGQICHKGSFWVLRYHEDREEDGITKRVRTTSPLALYSDYPYKGTEADLNRLRDMFQDKIASILAPLNREAPIAKSGFTLGQFIEQSYFPRLDYRLTVAADNELHIEPSTVKGYKDIWESHVKDNGISKIPIRIFTARDARTFLESLPHELSHNTHMRIKAFLSGVFSWAIADSAFEWANPFDNQKAGGRKKGEVNLEGLTEGQKRRREKIKASHEHAYTLEEVAEMMDKRDRGRSCA